MQTGFAFTTDICALSPRRARRSRLRYRSNLISTSINRHIQIQMAITSECFSRELWTAPGRSCVASSFISYWARIRQGSVCIQHETTALLSTGHLFRAYSAHFQALRLCPALDWKIVSMQILLREGFHSLRHNLPPGSPTFFFFSTVALAWQ